MNVATQFQRLRRTGDRATPVRSALMTILSESNGPLGVADLSQRLMRKKLRPNKTTLYRALGFMVERGWIHELDFGNGRKSYEWAEGHHHHLVCRECHRVEEVETNALEDSFLHFERGLGRKSKFASLTHSLEFYGLCAKCQ